MDNHSGDWMLADADGDTCEMLDDGYVSLKISRFPSEDKLDVVFALGQLAAIYMLKVGNGPDPISPALLECVINGVDSIVDLPWIQCFYQSLSPTLALLPVEYGSMSHQPEDCVKLMRIFHARMDSSVSSPIS